MNKAYSLYNYQSDAIEWMSKREHTTDDFKGGILADEVGLGKTIMMTGTLIKNPKLNTLIILPKSLILQWKSELQKYTNILDVHIPKDDILDMNTNPSVTRVHIVSHSRFNKRGIDDSSKLPYCLVEWDRVVIDEAHIIKNKKSKIHKAVCNLKSPIRWALTATPIMNKMTDFVYTIKWVSQDQINQLDCQTERNNIVEKYILRRTKDDVKIENSQFELPPLNVETNCLEFLTKVEEELYTNKYKEMQEKIQELKKTIGNRSVIYALELLLRARQICCHPQCYIDGINKKQKIENKKLKGIKDALHIDEKPKLEDWNSKSTKVEFVKSKIDDQPLEDKTLIFCHFIKEMDIYQKELIISGHSVRRIDGRIDMETRDQIVQSFKETPTTDQKQIMLVQIDMGGQGFNFQCANRMFITSPTWNPAQQHQVIGRSHRTGQTKPVYVNILTIANKDQTKPYVETNILEIQKTKRKLMAEVLKDQRLIEEEESSIADSGKLTFQDMQKVFGLKV